MTDLEYEELHDRFLDVVESGAIDIASAKLKQDPSWANSGYDGGSRPLHRVRHSNMAELLIEHGAKVNARGIDDETPLHRATRDGHIDVIPALIAAGADVNVFDLLHRTPLSNATQEQYDGPAIAKLLLDAGARYDLTSAAGLGDLASVEKILQEQSDAVRKVPSVANLLSGILFNNNCADPNRAAILALVLSRGLPLSRAEALKYSCSLDRRDAHLAAMLEQYAQTQA